MKSIIGKDNIKYASKYYAKHRLERIEYERMYRIKNKEKCQERSKKYYLTHKEDFKIYQHQYRIEHQKEIEQYREEHKEERKEKRIKNKDKIRTRQQKYYLEALKSWEGYIPKKTNCEICGREIFFGSSNIKNAISFDHRYENCAIKIGPTLWLRNNRMTEENKKIWESCRFGFLCTVCNGFLPGKNRKEWLIQVDRYVNK